MLTIGTIPILFKIIGKIDIKPITQRLKEMDIFDEPTDGKSAARQLSKEKVGILAFEILGDITPQLGKIADDLPPLIAAYKGISVDEAKKLDAVEVISELIHDAGIRSFFKTALRKKTAQGA